MDQAKRVGVARWRWAAATVGLSLALTFGFGLSSTEVARAAEASRLSLAEAVQRAQRLGPEFAAVRREQERTELAQRSQQAGYQPQLSFTGTLGLQQSNAPTPGEAHTLLPLPVGVNAWQEGGVSLSWMLESQWQIQGRVSVRPQPEGNLTSASVGLQRSWPSREPAASPSRGVTAGGIDTASSGTSPAVEAARLREARNQALAGVVSAWYRARQALGEWQLAREQQAVAEWEYEATVHKRDLGGSSLRELVDAQDQLRQAEERTRSAYAEWLAAWQALLRQQGESGSAPEQLEPLEQLSWADDYAWDALAVRVAQELGVSAGGLPGVEPVTRRLLPAGLAERLMSVRSAGVQAQEGLRQAEAGWQTAQAQKGWSTQASLQWNLQSGQGGRPPQGGWQALMTFSHPLHEPSVDLELERARLRREEAAASLAAQQERLVAEVVDGWQRLQGAQQALADAQIGQERSRQTVLAADARHEQGLVGWNDWRRAHLALAQAQAQVALAQAQYNQALLALADRLGLDLCAGD